MRIATDTVFNTLVGNVQNMESQQSTLQSELATGLTFSQPSDNPTGMASVLDLVSQDRQVSQYSANANTALQASQASYSGLTQFNQLSSAVDEIATKANNGTDSSSQLQTYATQIDQYLEQALQLGNSQFEGNYIYSGTAVDQAPSQATRNAQGQITTVTYVGNNSQASIPVSTSASISPTTSGATNQSMAGFMNQLVSLRDALQINDPVGIASAQAQLSASGDTLVSATAENSAIQSGIEAIQSHSTSLQQNLDSIISSDSSADVATTATKLTESQTAYQAVLASSARIMQTSLLNYLTTT